MAEENQADAPKPEDTPGTPEYDAKMAERFDKSQDPETYKEKPDDLPKPDIAPMPENGQDKFYNAETGEYDWQSHAKDAEYRAAQKKGDPEEPAKDDDKTGDEAVKNVIEDAGLTVDGVEAEIRENRELSPETVEKLVQQGIPRELIDSHVALAVSEMDRATAHPTEYAGGEEAWQAISDWAATNLEDGTKKMINDLLASSNWRDGIDLLKTKMDEASPTGREGDLAMGGGAAGGVTGFSSKQEQSAAINDPRYRTDPLYRQEVMQRIGKTDSSKFIRR